MKPSDRPSVRHGLTAPTQAGWAPWAEAVVIAAAGFAAYANTFSVPLLYDDAGSITDNPTIRHIGTAFFAPGNTTVAGRPILNLSLAINYAVGGTDLRGLHATNLAIHVIAGLTLFGIIRRIVAARADRLGNALAFCGALIWTIHPLLTESVTYTIQRAESLMGLFYLQTIYWFLRSLGPPDSGQAAQKTWPGRASHLCGLLSVLTCACGMATKEVMVSAPLVVLLIDRQLFSGGFSEALRRRKGYYLGLFATWIPLCILAWNTGNRGGTSGFGSGVSVWKYWATQPEAIFRYLRLAIWPRPLVFDYGTEWLSTGGHPLNSYGVIFRVIVPVAVVAGLAATTLVGLARNRMYGVLGFLFFATLAPTSLIPGNHQTAAEHRMYLALIPVVVLVTAAVFRVFGRAAPAACLALAAAYGITAEVRNRDYSSEVAIWTDTAAKKPQNPLAHLNLGNVYSAYPSRSGEAIAQYEEALRLEPDFLEAHNNLGVLLAATPGRTEDAVGHFRRAIELNPRYADAHYNLGNALDSLGRTREAIAQFEEAVRLNPALVAARCNLGSDLGATDRTQDAIAQFEEALRLSPDDPVILYDLAFELLKSGGRAQAAAGP